MKHRNSVLFHLSSRIAIVGVNKSGQSRNSILLNAEKQIASCESIAEEVLFE